MGEPAEPGKRVSLVEVLREWGRIGVVGFGGPPVHISLYRERFVQRRRWLDAGEFEDAIAATGMLPGPASTQLGIYCAWRVRGAAGAIVGGLAFILPGLVAIIALAAVFLATAPPEIVLAAGAGAGSAVAAVALHAGWGLLGPSLDNASGHREAWLAYVAAGALAAALAGPWVVLVLLGAGGAEMLRRGQGRGDAGALSAWPALVPIVAAAAGGLWGLAWVAFKVGALSYGGGFVIIPLMQADAVDTYGWMTDADFLNAVALGQVTPGPVVCTVAVVGYAAAGVGGALLAATIAFAPSFALVLGLAPRFQRLRASDRVRSFLDGSGPAAIGAILGVSVPLAASLGEAWQFAVLAAAVAALFWARASVVPTLLGAAGLGCVLVLAGLSLP